MNSFQHVQRPGLIVYGIERRDEVVRFRLRPLVEIAEIHGDEVDVRQPSNRGLAARALGRVFGEVHPDEPAPGKPPGQCRCRSQLGKQLGGDHGERRARWQRGHQEAEGVDGWRSLPYRAWAAVVGRWVMVTRVEASAREIAYVVFRITRSSRSMTPSRPAQSRRCSLSRELP